MKILFVYPNKEGYPIIPLGISLLISILKNNNHEVELFDATFLMSRRLDNEARVKTKVVKEVDVGKYWGYGDEGDVSSNYVEKLISFSPDLVAFSVVENNYGMFLELVKLTKSNSNALTIVGGMMPTVVPNVFSSNEDVDIICVGEGEKALVDLLEELSSERSIKAPINNLIIKGINEEVEKYNSYYDWKPVIYQDWDIFDKRHLYKPFDGKMLKAGFFEMSRGCPNRCSYCNNDIYQNKFKCLGGYRREKSIDSTIEEILYMKVKYSLEMIFFNDENFTMMSKVRFREFCDKYKEKINLPFFIAGRAETLLNEEKIKLLKETNCVTIGIGVEVGNENRRKVLLNKNTPNKTYRKAFSLCNKYGIRTSAYVIIGLPFETEKDIIENIEFCREIKPSSLAVSMFAPYYGTQLRNVCIQNGFIEDKYYDKISINWESILNQPQLSNETLEKYYYDFQTMVYGS